MEELTEILPRPVACVRLCAASLCMRACGDARQACGLCCRNAFPHSARRRVVCAVVRGIAHSAAVVSLYETFECVRGVM